MTENKRFIFCNKTTDSNVWDTSEKQCYGWEYVVSLLNGFDGTIKDLSDDYQRLMEKNKKLKEENKQLKSSFTEFAKMIEFDIDNGIEVYPKRLLEYIINISKELKE